MLASWYLSVRSLCIQQLNTEFIFSVNVAAIKQCHMLVCGEIGSVHGGITQIINTILCNPRLCCLLSFKCQRNWFQLCCLHCFLPINVMLKFKRFQKARTGTLWLYNFFFFVLRNLFVGRIKINKLLMSQLLKCIR